MNTVHSLPFSSRLLLILTLSVADLSGSQSATAPAELPRQETQPLVHVVKVPVRLLWGYLVIVEGSIGSLQKLSFLVDTAAYPSVIDQRLARHLHLVEQPARVNLSRKTIQAHQVALPSLLIGPIRVDSLPVLTQDLSFLHKAFGFKIDGIVGLDVLRKSNFTINYRTQEVLFGPVERLTFSAPFETDLPVVTIRMGFQNRHLRLVVDTGSPDLTLFHSRLSDISGISALGTDKVTDVSGTFQRRKVGIPEVFLGEETIGAQVAFVVDDQKDDGDNFDGVLGVRGSQFWKIAFDFEHRKFRWEGPPHAANAKSKSAALTAADIP
jgi:hypothetical protein